MRARLAVLIAAAIVCCLVSGAAAQWAPRRVVRSPVRRGPVSRGTAPTRGPVRSQRASVRGPITRRPLTPTSRRRDPRDVDWESARGAPSVEYKAYDTVVSDPVRGYTTFPGDGYLEW